MCWPNLSNDTLVPPNTCHLRFMQSTSIKYKHAHTNKTQEQDILVGVKSFKLLNKHRCLMLLTFFTFLSILGQVWYSSEVKISEVIKEAQFMRKFKVQSSWFMNTNGGYLNTAFFSLRIKLNSMHKWLTAVSWQKRYSSYDLSTYQFQTFNCNIYPPKNINISMKI